jgi:hypothetical protein
MRRATLISLLLLALSLGSASSSEAALYRDGGDGIRIVLRVQGAKVVWANVFVRLYCKRPNGERHLNRYKLNYASPQHPLRLDRRGRFRWDTRGQRQEEGFTQEDALIGRVGAERITGQYEYYRSFTLGRRDVTCQTRSYPFGPALMSFQARRR